MKKISTLLLVLTAYTSSLHTEETLPSPEYNNRIFFFFPLTIGYERIQPQAPYYALQIRTLTECSLEARIGYNFDLGNRKYLAPFLGFDCLTPRLSLLPPSSSSYDATYITLGSLYRHELTSWLDVGFNAKLLVHPRPIIGWELSLPISFRFGANAQWDFRVEPYQLMLYDIGCRHQAFPGIRLEFGYRF